MGYGNTFAAVDIDLDGDMDLASNQYYILNEMDETTDLKKPLVNEWSKAYGYGLAGSAISTLVDLNNDGTPELVRKGTKTAEFYVVDGTFTENAEGDKLYFQTPIPIVPSQGVLEQITFEDVDGDNFLDCVFTYRSGVAYMRNNGDLTFSDLPVIMVTDGMSKAFDIHGADLDGDGDTDFVIGQYYYSVPYTHSGYILSNGDGTFDGVSNSFYS